MADMTITVTVTARGVSWSRTTTIEVDAALYQQGDLTTSRIGGSETIGQGASLYSYSGMAVAFLANKAISSLAVLIGTDSSDNAITSPIIPPCVPFIYYGGAGTGFTGAINATATSTDLPTVDLDSVVTSMAMGVSETHSIVGLKAIS
jgi:hypothetical protein